ncbi:MAG: isoprenylcysteine carboxylmethyltransferase family protein [Candidatus Micrarchaeota archaeon]
MQLSALKTNVLLLYLIGVIALGLFFFVPAGTIDYWQAWVYLFILFVPAFFVSSYFLGRDPKFLERRMKMKEKEIEQKLIVKLSGVIFLIGFLIPGFDRRFGWSSIPSEFVLVAEAFVVIGYILIFLVFKENHYASRTVEVEKGQKVIITGPYSIVRHPMYVGVLVMFLATPIALGSYFALPIFLLMIPLLVYRIFNEEKILLRDLAGYKKFCQKTRYRLIPFIW